MLDDNRPNSIGKILGFYGNFGVMVRAYVYIRMLGGKGLKRASSTAILNANYLMRKLEKAFLLPHKQHAMHEFVLSGDWQKEKGVKTPGHGQAAVGLRLPRAHGLLPAHRA